MARVKGELKIRFGLDVYDQVDDASEDLRDGIVRW